MIVVLDSNVLISAIITDGICNEILHYCIRANCLFLSEFILSETENILIRKLKFTDEKVQVALGLIREETRISKATPLTNPVSRDAKDDLVLSTVKESKATHLVSGDKDLLTLKEFEGAKKFLLEIKDRIVAENPLTEREKARI